MKHHSTFVPEVVLSRLKQVAGREPVMAVALRILERFKGRLLGEVIAGFGQMASYTRPKHSWVRLPLVLPEELKSEIEAVDKACPPIMRGYIAAVVFVANVERLSALAKEEEVHAEDIEAAVA